MALSANSSFFTPLFRVWPIPPCRLSRPLTFNLPVNPRAFNTVNSSVRAGQIALTAAFSFIQLRRRPQSACMASVPSRALTTGDPQGPQLVVLENDEELLDSLAKYTTALSKKFCEERGTFTVVLSGGSLIKSLRKLVEPPYSDLIDWEKWHVFWIDERVVPKNHPDSNYKLAFDEFLSKVQIPTDQVHAINDSLSTEAAAEDYENRIKHLVCKGVVQLSLATGFPKFDLQLLGMGPDGHIASLFPGHPLLHETTRWVASIQNSPKPPLERITFTIPVINSSAYIALVVIGSGKADVVRHVFGSIKPSSVSLPVQMIKLDDNTYTWFIDKAAASKL